MKMQKNFNMVAILAVVSVLLSGCASWFFPDFEEPTETVVDDGGKVQEHKIDKKGILISDKENALHEGDADEAKEAEGDEKIEAQKVIPVEAEELEPDTVKTVEGNFKGDMSAEVKPVESGRPSVHYLAETIYFGNGGASIEAGYQQSLKKIAKLAKEHKAVVTIYGFASSRTRNMDPVAHKLANFKVSEDRAKNIAKELRRLGVRADKIVVQALSDTMPLYQEIMPEGERLNRRAEIYLTY